jgi:membrane protein YqaA with SNARE-associated domain
MTDNPYMMLFQDNFGSALFFMFDGELIFHIMMVMGSFGTGTVLFIALFGTLAGQMMNWMVGSSARNSFKKDPKEAEKITTLFMGNAKFLVFFTWFPIIGGLISLVAGFARMPLIPFCVVSIVGNIVFFGYYVIYYTGMLALPAIL